MKSVIALRTILDSKTVRCISSLGSLARLHILRAYGDEKKISVLRADLAAPARIGYLQNLDKFVYHLRHRSPPQSSSSSFVAVSRNRNFRNRTDHGDSHARTSVYVVDTRHAYTTDTLPITTDTRIFGPI